MLAMLRNIARDGISAEPVLPVVRELSASSGRHISNVNIILLSNFLNSHILTEVYPIPRSGVRLAAPTKACCGDSIVYSLWLP